MDDILILAAGECRRLGESLCAAGRITPQQLEDALAKQLQSGRRLGEILVAMGAITREECDIAMEFQKRLSGAVPTAALLRLGEILVATGQIKREELEQSLERQKLTGTKLGEDLVAAGHATQHQIDRALHIQQKLVAAVLAAALSMGAVATLPAAAAAPDTANLSVTATVLKHANLRVVAQPATVAITEADIARGYVDVSGAAQVEINSNSPNGYMLVFEYQGDFVRQTQVRGLGHDAQFGESGGAIIQPVTGHGMTNRVVELGFRFMLAEGARAGVHAWPVQLSVVPQ